VPLLIFLFVAGCATVATVSEDGRTITLKSPPFTNASAEFPDGHKISKAGAEMPDINALSIDPTINMPMSAPVDALMQGK